MGKIFKGLRNLYDQIEGHVRALNTAGVTAEHYGALLIPIIVEKLPDEIKLEISRKLGTQNWKIDAFMKILKVVITLKVKYKKINFVVIDILQPRCYIPGSRFWCARFVAEIISMINATPSPM